MPRRSQHDDYEEQIAAGRRGIERNQEYAEHTFGGAETSVNSSGAMPTAVDYWYAGICNTISSNESARSRPLGDGCQTYSVERFPEVAMSEEPTYPHGPTEFEPNLQLIQIHDIGYAPSTRDGFIIIGIQGWVGGYNLGKELIVSREVHSSLQSVPSIIDEINSMKYEFYYKAKQYLKETNQR